MVVGKKWCARCNCAMEFTKTTKHVHRDNKAPLFKPIYKCPNCGKEKIVGGKE